MLEDDRKKKIAKDGEKITVPLALMDGAPTELHRICNRALHDANLSPVMHRPGFVQLSDAEKTSRERLYRDHDEKLTERWKNPTQAADHSSAVQAVGERRPNAYQRYQERISNAWRHR